MKKLIAVILSALCATILSGCGPDVPNAPTIKEATVYDEHGITITVTGFHEDSFWGPEIDLAVENATGKDIILAGYDYIVNGITLEGTAHIPVAAGQKGVGTISLLDSELDIAGIVDIATVTAKSFTIYDADSFAAVHDATFDVHASISGTRTQELPLHTDPIFEKDGITISICGVYETQMYQSVVLVVTNNYGEDIAIVSSNECANGYTISADLSDTVYDGTVRFCGIDYPKQALKDSHIDTIEDVVCDLEITDLDSGDIVASLDGLRFLVPD